MDRSESDLHSVNLARNKARSKAELAQFKEAARLSGYKGPKPKGAKALELALRIARRAQQQAATKAKEVVAVAKAFEKLSPEDGASSSGSEPTRALVTHFEIATNSAIKHGGEVPRSILKRLLTQCPPDLNCAQFHALFERVRQRANIPHKAQGYASGVVEQLLLMAGIEPNPGPGPPPGYEEVVSKKRRKTFSIYRKTISCHIEPQHSLLVPAEYVLEERLSDTEVQHRCRACHEIMRRLYRADLKQAMFFHLTCSLPVFPSEYEGQVGCQPVIRAEVDASNLLRDNEPIPGCCKYFRNAADKAAKQQASSSSAVAPAPVAPLPQVSTHAVGDPPACPLPAIVPAVEPAIPLAAAAVQDCEMKSGHSRPLRNDDDDMDDVEVSEGEASDHDFDGHLESSQGFCPSAGGLSSEDAGSISEPDAPEESNLPPSSSVSIGTANTDCPSGASRPGSVSFLVSTVVVAISAVVGLVAARGTAHPSIISYIEAAVSFVLCICGSYLWVPMLEPLSPSRWFSFDRKELSFWPWMAAILMAYTAQTMSPVGFCCSFGCVVVEALLCFVPLPQSHGPYNPPAVVHPQFHWTKPAKPGKKRKRRKDPGGSSDDEDEQPPSPPKYDVRTEVPEDRLHTPLDGHVCTAAEHEEYLTQRCVSWWKPTIRLLMAQRCVVPYDGERRLVDARSVQEAKQDLVVIRLTYRAHRSPTIPALAAVLFFAIWFAVRWSVQALIRVQTTAPWVACAAIFPLFIATLIWTKPNIRVTTYAPHLASAVALNFRRGTPIELLDTNISQVIKRYAALPIRDVDAFALTTGTSDYARYLTIKAGFLGEDLVPVSLAVSMPVELA